MVQNPECLTITLASLLKHINAMVAAENHHNDNCVVDQYLGKLLSQMLIVSFTWYIHFLNFIRERFFLFQTAINEFDICVLSPKDKKNAIAAVLCPAVKYSVQLLVKGGRCLQFTALCILNKVRI